MDIKFILLYSLTVFIASIIPGPSMLLALNHGIKYGLRSVIFTALGNNAATFIQALLSILGLSIILLKSVIIFYIIKYLGIAYLIFIGFRMFLFPDVKPAAIIGKDVKTGKFHNLFLEAFIITIGNPKAIIFFTALFPQFINAETNTSAQYFFIISILLIIAFLCMMIYGFIGNKLMLFFGNIKIKKAFDRIIGGSFIGLGIAMALSRRN